MKKSLSLIFAFFLSMFFTICTFASINYSFDTSPTKTKTITWNCSDGSAEFRYVSGEANSDSYDSAIMAGNGNRASIEVDSNGIYTLFAKYDDVVYSVSVPVTTIDRNEPDITVTGVKRETNGLVMVNYTVSDYFGVAETRIAEGNLTSTAFNTGSPISGGTISGLKPGSYTIFAKDKAGNIATYTMDVESSEEGSSRNTENHSEWSSEYSAEWGSTWVKYDYDVPTVVQDIPDGKELVDEKKELLDIPVEPTEPGQAPSQPDEVKIEKFPQTGGLMESRMTLFYLAIFLLVIGCWIGAKYHKDIGDKS